MRLLAKGRRRHEPTTILKIFQDVLAFQTNNRKQGTDRDFTSVLCLAIPGISPSPGIRAEYSTSSWRQPREYAHQRIIGGRAVT